MPAEYVYVFIWENNSFGNKKVKVHSWPGHAAMNLGNKFMYLTQDGRTYSPNKNLYVSWFPSSPAKFTPFTVFMPKSVASPNLCFTEDIKTEGYYPDHIFKYYASEEKLAKMRTEWNQIRTKNKAHYGSFRKNCSTIVSRIIHAADLYALKWAIDNQVVWSPVHILRLVLNIDGFRQMKWSEYKTDLGLYQNPEAADPDFWELTFSKDNGEKRPINKKARDQVFCSLGIPCRFNNGNVIGN